MLPDGGPHDVVAARVSAAGVLDPKRDRDLVQPGLPHSGDHLGVAVRPRHVLQCRLERGSRIQGHVLPIGGGAADHEILGPGQGGGWDDGKSVEKRQSKRRRNGSQTHRGLLWLEDGIARTLPPPKSGVQHLIHRRETRPEYRFKSGPTEPPLAFPLLVFALPADRTHKTHKGGAMPNRAVVMSGGGSKGAFQVGALDYLIQD